MRMWLAVASVSVLVSATSIAAAAPVGAAPAGVAPSSVPEPLSQGSASAQAQATGQPVAVTSQSTETSQVMANPDGSFTLTAGLRPVRVLQDGAWTPIDTTLHANGDGSLSPAASTAQLAFSGGGATPLVRLTNGAQSIAFSWPAPLPRPAVTGDTATYPSVLPGVDLKLTAHADSYSEILVVHDAAAAANPALAKLRMTATASGLNFTAAPDGGLSATDATGAEVFHGSTPIMWDSSANAQTGPAPTLDNPGSAKVNVLAVSVPGANAASKPAGSSASTTVTLTPPTSALTGTGVVYPLYLDPSMSPYRSHFAVVFNHGWHYYDDTSNDLQVGD